MKLYMILPVLTFLYDANAQNVGIGTAVPDSSALLHIDLGTNNSKGLLITGNYNSSSTVPDLGAGSRMMFYPGKAAFRAGWVGGTEWNNSNVGIYSFAAGNNCMASGNYSIAMGLSSVATGHAGVCLGYSGSARGSGSTSIGFITNADGHYSVALGYGTTTVADGSVAIGYSLVSKAAHGVAFGIQNDLSDNPSPTSPQATDRILQVGNGSTFTRSNAMTILRNGNTGIGTVGPGARLSVSANGADLAGSAMSSLFRTHGGILGNNVGSELSLGGFGFAQGGNNISLGIRAYKSTTASGWTGTAFLLGMDVDNSVRPGNGYLAFSNDGKIGINTPTPAAPLGFPAILGEKITLYPGSTGDVGMSVQANQFRIYSDHSGASVLFGYDQGGIFTRNMEVYGSGDVWCRGSLFQNSDGRLKKNISPIGHALAKITRLTGYHYFWNNSNLNESMQTGVLAQEVEQVMPELVTKDENGIMSVNYNGLIPVLIESIKEQQEMIRKQQYEIEELRKEIGMKK